jgi:hypothetical protein
MMNYKERERTIKLYIGAFILVATGMGSILAANIFISTPSSGQEFGQGEYLIKTCDTWIRLDLQSGATGEAGAPEGFSPLTGISISGLDAKQCAGTSFSVGVIDRYGFDLPLYRTDGQVGMCSDVLCTDTINSFNTFTLNIDAQGTVGLQSTDLFHELAFDQTNGVYTVHFAQPTILARDIARLTIQSSNL